MSNSAEATCVCAAFCGVSALLIFFNAYLMKPGRFPWAITLTAVQMGITSTLSAVLYVARPHLFPKMATVHEQSYCAIGGRFAVIGLISAIILVVSNEAYLYCSVSFLQFMKQGNLVFSFLLSCLVGREVMGRVQAFVIAVVCFGVCTAVVGEKVFVVFGVVLQLTSMALGASNRTLMEFTLTGNFKFDSFSFVLLMAPVALVWLLLAHGLVPSQPLLPALVAWWPLLLLNGLTAFVQQVLVASVLARVSTVGFTMCSISRDIFIVSSAAMFLGGVALVQGTGFVVALVGIYVWAHIKIHPDGDVASELSRALWVPSGDLRRKPDETTPLTQTPVSSAQSSQRGSDVEAALPHYRCKALVTGSDGFLGKKVVAALRAQGCEVCGFDFAKGQDIVNLEHVASAFAEFKPDVCAHLAAVADLNFFRTDPKGCERINVQGTRNVLSVCDKHGVRMLFASTCCCYGNNGRHPSTEEAPLCPTEPYAESKKIGEGLVEASQAAGAEHVIMRLATFYGPGMRAALCPAIFLDRAHQNKTLLVHGSGTQTRTFTYIDDIVSGIVAVLRSKSTYRVVNVTSTEIVSVLDIARVAMQITGQQPEIQHVEDRPGQIYEEMISNDKLRSLGWEPVTDFATGMQKSYNDYVACGGWVQSAGVGGTVQERGVSSQAPGRM